MARKRKWDLRTFMAVIHDLLLRHPDGLTIIELSAMSGYPRLVISNLLKDYRRALHTENMNVPADPTRGGRTRHWKYRLVGDLSEVEKWRRFMERNISTRAGTVEAVDHSMLKGVVGRSRSSVSKREFLNGNIDTHQAIQAALG